MAHTPDGEALWEVDEVDDSPPDRVEYGPPGATVPLLIAFAAVLVAVAITGDSAQRYAGGAAAVLVLLAAGWVSRGPAVVADRAGITVRRLIGQRHLAWHEVVGLRRDERRRSHLIELETERSLVLIPAYLLGRTRLATAERELSALRHPGTRPPTDPR